MDDTDPDQEAYAAVALVDGLAARLLVHSDRHRRAHAVAAIEARMAVVFPGPCTREQRPG